MSSPRAWIAGKLREAGFPSQEVGTVQLLIKRDGRPDARVACIGRETCVAGFDAAALAAAVDKNADCGFFVVVPTDWIAHSAYAAAEDHGVCVAGYGELLSALQADDDIRLHIDSQEKYERRRLATHAAVSGLRRKGQHAYEISRRNKNPLTIVTTNHYEFTADAVYDIIESYDGLNVEFVVVTNPNCHGLSTESVRAAEHAGVRVVLLSEFLNGLEGWT